MDYTLSTSSLSKGYFGSSWAVDTVGDRKRHEGLQEVTKTMPFVSEMSLNSVIHCPHAGLKSLHKVFYLSWPGTENGNTGKIGVTWRSRYVNCVGSWGSVNGQGINHLR